MEHISFSCKDLVEYCKVIGIHGTFDCCQDSIAELFTAGKYYQLQLPPQTSVTAGVLVLLKVVPGERKTKTTSSFYPTDSAFAFATGSAGWFERGSFYHPGTHTVTILRKTVVHNVNKPPNNTCEDGSDYDALTCITKCLSQPFLDFCGCVTADSRRVENLCCT